jgi:hypothetical protein
MKFPAQMKKRAIYASTPEVMTIATVTYGKTRTCMCISPDTLILVYLACGMISFFLTLQRVIDARS